jgi:adenosylcobinamide kinase/adenosylcobinamide-phosphate guanylyltransferase
MKTGTVLVIGGARSGKSAFAERLVTESGLDRVCLATAHASDKEMLKRIAEHRKRRGAGWRTVEAQEQLEYTLTSEAGEGKAVLVDCLTLWLSNIMNAGADPETRSQALCEAARRRSGLIVFVSNEVGMGLVPETPVGRAFRDAQGRLNQAVAQLADRVILTVAGLPLYLKGGPA